MRILNTTQCLAVALGILVSGSVFAKDDTHVKDQTLVNASALDLNQNIGQYLGKRVALNGKIDRVLGNGSYIIADTDNPKDPAHKVMIFTVNGKSKVKDNGQNQQSGIAAPTLKEGDAVQLTGKVEQFIVSNEVDTFSPKSRVETFDESTAATPVVVIQPGALQHG